MNGCGLVRGIWCPAEVRDRDDFSNLLIVIEYFFESGENVRTRPVERDTDDVDRAGGRKVNALDRGSMPKLDDIPR